MAAVQTQMLSLWEPSLARASSPANKMKPSWQPQNFKFIFFPFNNFLLNTSVCYHCFPVRRLLEKTTGSFPVSLAACVPRSAASSPLAIPLPSTPGRQLSSPTACLDNKRGCSLTSAGGNVPGCLAVPRTLCQAGTAIYSLLGKRPACDRGHSLRPCWKLPLGSSSPCLSWPPQHAATVPRAEAMCTPQIQCGSYPIFQQGLAEPPRCCPLNSLPRGRAWAPVVRSSRRAGLTFP